MDQASLRSPGRMSRLAGTPSEPNWVSGIALLLTLAGAVAVLVCVVLWILGLTPWATPAVVGGAFAIGCVEALFAWVARRLRTAT